MLNFANYFYGLDIDQCPADHHFVQWLDKSSIRRKNIFHFGTGGHHLVGMKNAELKWGNAIQGITASPQEYQAYIDLAVAQPGVMGEYKVYFGDIYQLDGRLLPQFDVVTLFHLCEFWSDKNTAYGGMNDLDLACLLADHLQPGGHMLFYSGSFAFAQAEPVIAKLRGLRPLRPIADHESLRVYQKT
jgi:hypothetical protein